MLLLFFDKQDIDGYMYLPGPFFLELFFFALCHILQALWPFTEEPRCRLLEKFFATLVPHSYQNTYAVLGSNTLSSKCSNVSTLSSVGVAFLNAVISLQLIPVMLCYFNTRT